MGRRKRGKLHHTKRRQTIGGNLLSHDLVKNAEKQKIVLTPKYIPVQKKTTTGSHSQSGSRTSYLKRKKAGCYFILFLFLVRLYWPAGTRMLRQLLIPGASETAFSSMAVLAQELWQGKPVKDAVEAYCRTILQEAGLPDG